MTFKDLLKAKDATGGEAVLADALLAEAETAFAKASEHRDEAVRAAADAHKAIHDHLAEFGAHNLVDPKDGQVTVYTAIDDEPGWRAHHPISGDAEFTPKPKQEAEAVA